MNLETAILVPLSLRVARSGNLHGRPKDVIVLALLGREVAGEEQRLKSSMRAQT